VDAFNLYHRCLQPLGMQWLNLATFFTRLRQDDQLLRVCYFTAELEGKRLPAQRAYHAALAMTPMVEVVLGRFQTQHVDCAVGPCQHSGERRFFHTKEKRTDVNIALRMLTDAFLDACDRLVLVSGDSDLVPAVRQVRARKKEVVVYVPSPDETAIGANELRGAATMNKNLPLRTLDRNQFAFPVVTPAGLTITRDPLW